MKKKTYLNKLFNYIIKMPKVVTTVNLDFDEKEEFVRKFGKAELSNFLRQAIHERLAEKNQEAGKDLSAIGRSQRCDRSILSHAGDKCLDGWIRYARQQLPHEILVEMHSKTSLLDKLVDGKIKGNRIIKRTFVS